EFPAKFQSAVFVTDVMGQFGIMPKHIWEDVPPADWPSDPGSTGQDPSRVIGTGSFKFVEWALGDHVTLERNPDYWDAPNIPIVRSEERRVGEECGSLNERCHCKESERRLKQ